MRTFLIILTNFDHYLIETNKLNSDTLSVEHYNREIVPIDTVILILEENII